MHTRALGSVIFIVLFAALLPASLAARTVYVASKAARLLEEPRMNAGGSALQRGASLEVIGEQGLFLRVRTANGFGWTPRMFVSPYPPAESNVDVRKVEKRSNANVRARASHYTEAAAARGVSESEEGVRTRGRLEDFDYAGLEWLEEQSAGLNAAAVNAFLRSGGLTAQ